LRHAGGAAARVVDVLSQLAWASVGRGFGAQRALLLVSLSSEGKWRGRRSAAGSARTQLCRSCRCGRGARRAVVGRPRVRRARGGAARVVVVLAQVAWSSVDRGCGALAAVLLVSRSSGGQWRGRRLAADVARTPRCCLCRCRFAASGTFVGQPRVRRSRHGAALVIVVLAQVAWSSVGRGSGAHAAVLLVSLTLGAEWRGCRSAAG